MRGWLCGWMCGVDLSEEEQDFSQVVKVSDEEMVYRLGSLVCDVSCSVLRGINSNLKTMEQQKRLSAEGRIAYGRDDVIVHGSGRTALSEHSDAEGAVSGITEAGQIRKEVDEKVTDIIVTLELGGTKADLDIMKSVGEN